MILSPPIPWRAVPAGAQVLLYDNDVPRTVIGASPWHSIGAQVVYLEGLEPLVLARDATVQLVIIDEADATANLRAAGLTATPIEPAP